MKTLIFEKFKTYIYLYILSVLYLLCFSTYASPLNDYMSSDLGVFRTMAIKWYNGAVIYKDIFDHKGPVVYLIQYAGYVISHNKFGIFLLETINLFFVLIFLHKISSLLCLTNKFYISLCAVLLFFVATIAGGNLTEEWSLLWIIIPLLLYLLYKRNGLNKVPFSYAFIMGICFGILSMIRINNACLNCAIIIVLTYSLVKNKEYKNLLACAFSFVGGISVVLLPFCLYFYYNDSFSDFIYGVFLFNFKYKDSFMETTPLLILSNMIKMLPILGLSVWISYKKRSSCFGLTSVLAVHFLIFTYCFYKSWGYQHYFTLLIPILFIAISLIDIKRRQKIIVSMIMVVVLLPFSIDFGKGILRNYVYDVHYKIPALYNSIKIPNIQQANILDIYDKIMSEIEPENRNKICTYGMVGHTGFFPHFNLYPHSKYFFNQDGMMAVDSCIEKETEFYFTHTPPIYVITDTPNSPFLKRHLQKYEMVLTQDLERGEPLNLYKLR